AVTTQTAANRRAIMIAAPANSRLRRSFSLINLVRNMEFDLPQSADELNFLPASSEAPASEIRHICEHAGTCNNTRPAACEQVTGSTCSFCPQFNHHVTLDCYAKGHDQWPGIRGRKRTNGHPGNR